MQYVTREMALDAGMPELEGQPYPQPEPDPSDLANELAQAHDRLLAYINAPHLTSHQRNMVLEAWDKEVGKTKAQTGARDTRAIMDDYPELFIALVYDFLAWDGGIVQKP